jgi:hypothetical protein
MKKITIGNRTLEYEIVLDEDDYGGYSSSCIVTDFYEGTEIINECYGFLLLKKRAVEKPKFIFTLRFDIEDPKITKEQLRKSLESKIEEIDKKDTKDKKILDRKAEIDRGELI